MGSNDHVPVPDPKPRVHVPPQTLRDLSEANAQKESLEANGYTSANNFIQVTERLNQLERSRERYEAQSMALRNLLSAMDCSITSLRRLLRQTSRGVDRLAQGKSRGNLGLPTEEDWKSSDITP